MTEPVERKSKSQVKREMLALQSLGERLVDLTPDQIDGLHLPQELHEALLFAKTLKKRESWRRQMQYIGALMREVDPEPLQKVLDDMDRGRGPDIQRFHDLERLRNGLVDGDATILEEVLNRFAEADPKQLNQLASKARRERETNAPPKASRTLFRYLKEMSNLQPGG